MESVPAIKNPLIPTGATELIMDCKIELVSISWFLKYTIPTSPIKPVIIKNGIDKIPLMTVALDVVFKSLPIRSLWT